MSIRLATILLIVSATASCTSVDSPDFAEVRKSKSHLFVEIPEPVEFDASPLNPECNQDGCTFSVEESNILADEAEEAERKIRELNNAVEAQAKAYNSLVRALIECEYGKQTRDATIQLQEKQSTRQEIVGIAKQVVIAGVCAITH